MSVEVEFVRWMLLMVAAVALVLALAAALGAADPMAVPQLLPEDMGTLAKPLTPVPRPFFPENPQRLPAAEAAALLWKTLEDHRAGCIAEALAGWEQLRLAEDAEHWGEIARGAVYLQAGDLIRANVHLETARRMDPGHPLVAYFVGILRLEQAQAVERCPDLLPMNHQRLVAYVPGADGVAFRMLAIEEFHRAIARADMVQLDQRLLDTEPLIEEAVVLPTAGDLVAALGADNFAGKAHHLLFGLYLDRGDLADAEFHLDQALATGLAALYGYQDLGAMHLARGDNGAAVRVAAKDLAFHCSWTKPLIEQFRHLLLVR